MERNIELLQQTMQHIKDHPEQHDQGNWVSECGTAACFAGRAALLSGKTIWRAMRVSYLSGAELLGITLEEASSLFNGYNTRPMLELMVKDLVNGDKLHKPEHYANELME